jgi:poly(3-hydroxybutyrate) depolymerase
MKHLFNKILLILLSIVLIAFKKDEGIDEYPHANALNYLVKTWSCDDRNMDIVLYVLKRGAHQWFTIENSGMDANEIIWEFFKSHPKNHMKE